VSKIPQCDKKASARCLSNRQSNPLRLNLLLFEAVVSWKVKMDRSLINDVPRDRYVALCKQRAFDYLERGDLRNAVGSFVGGMSARPDCELPHHLAALGVLLLMGNDALGWKTLIKEIR
jgi:hypothetical protein